MRALLKYRSAQAWAAMAGPIGLLVARWLTAAAWEDVESTFRNGRVRTRKSRVVGGWVLNLILVS